MRIVSRHVVLVASILVLGLLGVTQAQNASNGTAPLVHIGLNVAACTGPFVGNDSGVVNAHFNATQSRLQINVSVHDALPNTRYVVDTRCVRAIGRLTTNSQGAGTAQITLPQTAPPAAFYVDIAVPPPGRGGASGYGDTFIAGPFNLQ